MPLSTLVQSWWKMYGHKNGRWPRCTCHLSKSGQRPSGYRSMRLRKMRQNCLPDIRRNIVRIKTNFFLNCETERMQDRRSNIGSGCFLSCLLFYFLSNQCLFTRICLWPSQLHCRCDPTHYHCKLLTHKKRFVAAKSGAAKTEYLMLTECIFFHC